MNLKLDSRHLALSLQSSEKLPPAFFLMGPTASGKTNVAVELAQRLPMEIISVDSALVYRGMNIGTAKPDAATLARAPHHLIDILDPTNAYSAAAFRHDALRLMHDITQRGRIPLLVGGTMLYFRALREGLSNLPQADPGVRAALDAEIAQHGIQHLHQQLALVDAETAARLKQTDTQRIQRALEIYRLTGQPMSALLKQKTDGELPYRILPIALIPSKRSVLHQRITTRFRQMLEQGLVEELRGLRQRYQLHPDLPSMRCVGYRQAWQFMEQHPHPDETTSHSTRLSKDASQVAGYNLPPGEGGTIASSPEPPIQLSPQGGKGDRLLPEPPIQLSPRGGKGDCLLPLGGRIEERVGRIEERAGGGLRRGSFSEINEAQLLETGIAATRQLAKRQLTWLRSMPDNIEIDCLAHNLAEQVRNTITRWLHV